MSKDHGASDKSDRATAAEPVVSALRDGIPSAELGDATTTFIGATRALWRSVMRDNGCIETRCTDIESEHCACLPHFHLLASSSWAIPHVVLEEAAQAIEARGTVKEFEQ